jgi:hypothetical protein
MHSYMMELELWFRRDQIRITTEPFTRILGLTRGEDFARRKHAVRDGVRTGSVTGSPDDHMLPMEIDRVRPVLRYPTKRPFGLAFSLSKGETKLQSDGWGGRPLLKDACIGGRQWPQSTSFQERKRGIGPPSQDTLVATVVDMHRNGATG